MNSSTSRIHEQRQTQEEIKRQIALLQAKLEPEHEEQQKQQEYVNRMGSSSSTKRKAASVAACEEKEGVTTLAPATPSPKKKKRKLVTMTMPMPMMGESSDKKSLQKTSSSKKPLFAPPPPPSNLLAKLASLDKKHKEEGGGGEEGASTSMIQRTDSFVQKASLPPEADDDDDDGGGGSGGGGTKRDDRLALIEDLEPGPYHHAPPVNDPNFETLEPHSGIRLSSRTLAHTDLSDHLLGRFYLSPSKLYSIVRLLPDRQAYDVPVPGDWVTIGVIAERGPIRYTRAPVGIDREEGGWGGRKKQGKDKGKGQEEGGGGGGKKYVNLKLIDFGARSKSTDAGGGGGRLAPIRGDAFLSLLLFESDGFDVESNNDNDNDNGSVVKKRRRDKKVYRGGSGGMFEHLTEFREGDVIALLNPRILKSVGQPGRTTSTTNNANNAGNNNNNNILALTPGSPNSIVVIGRSADLGMCTVRKKDGKLCGAWCDKRVSLSAGEGVGRECVCDYHVECAVRKGRAGRGEFLGGTSTLSTSAKQKPKYDPLRQWGLLPSTSSSSAGGGGGGGTYVLSGHIICNNKSLYDITENMGREGQARAKRRVDQKEEEMKLVKMLGGKGKVEVGELSSEEEEEDRTKGKKEKKMYSAEFVKSLGFDPSSLSHRGGDKDNEKGKRVQEKLDALQTALSSRKEIELGHRPGERVRSGVVVPRVMMVDLDED